ncbi:MAG: cardiolipin synthase [Bacillota bacterium]|nr:cardiolipin synthase [Bacillota bacterium]
MTSALITAIYLINFISILTTVYVERKKPVTAVVWILVLTFIPIIGFILYFIFGRNLRPNQKKVFRLKKIYDEFYSEHFYNEKKIYSHNNDIFNDEVINSYKDIIEMNIASSKSLYSQDNEIEIFTNGPDKFDSLLKDIENAVNSIHMLYYIINDDNIGNRIVNLLTKKAKEGVMVRLLYDQVGSLFTPSKMFKDLIKAGGKVHRFFPLKFGTYLSINYRNHRKIVVIDGKIGYTGGINIGDEYLGSNKKLSPWRDTHLRIIGTSVLSLQERFLMDWYYASGEKIDTLTDLAAMKKLFPISESKGNKGNIGMQIVSSGPDSAREQIKRGYMKMVSSAKEKLYIETPYFIPDDSFLEVLQISAACGVDVRVILPSIADYKFVHRATTSYIKDLMDYGIKVYFYPGFIHAKMMVVDGKITSIGSANFDIRSFMLDFELNAFIYDTKFSSKCNEIFENDMKISTLVTKDWYRSRGLLIKFEEGLSRLFSPLL